MIAARAMAFGPRRDLNADTVLEMTIPQSMLSYAGYGIVTLNVRPRTQVSTTVTVDWGDGTVERVPSGNASHRYEDAEKHTIRIGKEASWFRFLKMKVPYGRSELTFTPMLRLLQWSDYLESADSAFGGCSSNAGGGLRGPLPPWGKSITDTDLCFEYCTNLSGPFPEWTDAITDAMGTFSKVTLSGPLPAWGSGLRDVTQCYNGCSGATGPVPAWADGIVKTSGCFMDCTGLVGAVPAWGRDAADINSTYFGCTGLTGDIPAWPSGVANVANCYADCSGLAGAWTDDAALLMPYEKLGGTSSTSKYYCCVTGASATLRALFYTDWGGTRAK